MRFVAPLNEAGEVDVLADAGADELYCGLLEPWWVQRYGDHDSASRRQGAANFSSRAELADACARARRRSTPVYLALNARYTEPQLDYLTELCCGFEDMGGTGVIVSDIGLLGRLEGRTGLRKILSLLAVAQNSETLRAFSTLGVNRVIFPRFIEADEAGELLHAVEGMEGEVMSFFDKCPWIDGYCRHRHGVAWPSRAAETDDAAAPLYTFDTTYHAHACMGAHAVYQDPYPCAACYLADFEAAGVRYAKLGGRGRALSERVAALEFLRSAREDPDRGRIRQRYQERFGACSCYYGKHVQRRSAICPAPDLEKPAHGTRRYAGSQTDMGAFRQELGALLKHRNTCETGRAASSSGHTKVSCEQYDDVPAPVHGSSCDDTAPLTLLIPPLSTPELAKLLDAVSVLIGILPPSAHLCVNDLGSAVAVSRLCNRAGWRGSVTMGTLLARTDDPREVSHFLSPEENPPRPVYGPHGEPRVLVYEPPTDELQRHWSHPSNAEPTASATIKRLAGRTISCEF